MNGLRAQRPARTCLRRADVAIDTGTRACQLRREIEAVFAEPATRVAAAERVGQVA